MSKIRVLHCLFRVGSGGVEQRRLSLIKHLDPSVFEQKILCCEAYGGLPKDYLKFGCDVHEVGLMKNIFDPDPYRKALKVTRDFRPQIIHGAVYEGVALSAVAGRLARVPVVIGEETNDPLNRSWKGSLLYRAFTALTHHMVAVSPAVESYLRQGIKLPAGKVSLINNGVAEKAEANPQVVDHLRKELKIKPGDMVIGTVGRLVDSHKRVSDLIRSLPQLIKDVENVKLLVVGDGPDEYKLRELAVTLKVNDRVLFVGYQADTQPYYNLMDIFVLASAHEAFGLVLVEAMFAGLPIVATRTGGIPKVVNEGETAFLVEPCNPMEIARSLLKLIADPETAREMGRKGRTRAQKYFSEERYVADVARLYNRQLSERGLA